MLIGIPFIGIPFIGIPFIGIAAGENANQCGV